jgi:protein-disulfide isomerase
MRIAAILAAVAVASPAAPLAAAPVHRAVPTHPAGTAGTRDWSRTVVSTPEGGFRMGNPAAKVKVVEYGSLTCPHCRHFAETGFQPLAQRYVRTGRVSYEYRNLILNAIDVAASLLARCTGPQFFRAAETIYATQPQWVGKVSDLPQDRKAQLQALPEGQRLVRIGAISGLTQMVGRFGLTPQQATLCLSSKAGMARLAAMAEAAGKIGVNMTPTFFVNRTRTDAATWEDLEPLIRNAGG